MKIGGLAGRNGGGREGGSWKFGSGFGEFFEIGRCGLRRGGARGVGSGA